MVGIDSMILIYAGLVPRKKVAKGTKSGKNEKLSRRARVLIHKLVDDTIVLPTIAIAELLIPVPKQEKGLLSAALAERFLCQPFDLHAAAVASDLWAQYKKLPTDLDYTNRQVLKSDIMIIATAHSAGAIKFYSHDKKCRELANLIMDGRDLPTHSEDLFFELEE